MISKLGAVVVASFVWVLIGSSLASAEVRSVVVQDPQDAKPTVSGVPNQPDIRQVAVAYDTAGSLTFTIDYYNAPATLDRSSKYGFYAKFQVGKGRWSWGSPYCDTAITGAISNGQHHVYGDWNQFYDRSAVTGYEGELEFSRITSPDGRKVTISASSPSIANVDFECFNYRLYSRYFSSAGDLRSNWDGNCGCWYREILDDEIGELMPDGYSVKPIYFTGHELQPSMPAAKYRLNPKPGCRAIELSYWTLLPDRVDGARRGWPGKIRFELRIGKKILIKSMRPKYEMWWRDIRPGKYELTAYYLGDQWRKASNKVTRTIRVRECRK